MLLIYLMISTIIFRHLRLFKYFSKIKSLCFPVVERLSHFQFVCSSNHFIYSSKTKLSHILSHFLGYELHIIHYMPGVTCIFFTKLRILSGNAYRTGIEMTNPHHDTPQYNQGGGRKSIFFSAKKSCYHKIPSSFHLAVSFQYDPASQII